MDARTTRRAVLAAAAALPAMSLPEAAAAEAAFGEVLRVNDLYPRGVPGPTGASRPLANFYATLAQVKAALPHLDFDFHAALGKPVTLSDEIDWAVLQSAADYIYKTNQAGKDANFACGALALNGAYVVNRTVTFNLAGVRIEGAAASDRFGPGATSVTWTGPGGGTVDAPVYIFDFWLETTLRAPPPGRTPVQSGGGPVVHLSRIIFNGRGGRINAATSAVSGYVSAIRIITGRFCVLEHLRFTNVLYDGIVNQGHSLFQTIRNCHFAGCHRDGLSFQHYKGDFATTFWIANNEFSLCGRYAIFLDLFGSVQAGPIIVEGNSFEHAFAGSFYAKNPEWFLHGLVAGVCFTNITNLRFRDNRFESVAGDQPQWWADIHISACGSATIEGNDYNGLACTTHSAASPRNRALIDYVQATGTADITDRRNFNVGVAGDAPGGNGCSNIRVIRNATSDKIFRADRVGIGEGPHVLEEGAAYFLSIPVRDGAHARIVEPRESAIVSLFDIEDWRIVNAFAATASWARYIKSYDGKTLTGTYQVEDGQNLFGVWQPNKAYPATLSAKGSATRYNVPNFAAPTTDNGFYYQVIVAGTSAASEPAWPRKVGGTVTDGGVTWRCAGRCSPHGDYLRHEEIELGKRRIVAAAPPQTGDWARGDQVINAAPDAGGNVGWICIAGGTPGTWKAFGAIAV